MVPNAHQRRWVGSVSARRGVLVNCRMAAWHPTGEQWSFFGARAMVIVVQFADGSERTLDVESVRMTVGGGPVELSLGGDPALLRISSPGDEAGWQRFVVHHSAANVMEVEVRSHRTDR